MKNRPAFSLVEAIITLTVIAIVMYNAIAVFIAANTKSFNIDAFTVAQSLANGKMEEIMARPFSLLTSEASQSSSGALAAFSREATVSFVSAEALNTPVAYGTDYKKITVKIFHPLLTSPLTLESIRSNS